LTEEPTALSLIPARRWRKADRAYVLKNGRIVMQGERPTLLADERLRTAYLGL
jgi:ABC-type branched-subunit amino acid transport system ATPase component